MIDIDIDIDEGELPMLDKFLQTTQLNSENILQCVTELEIYEFYYGSSLKVGSHYLSPFTKGVQRNTFCLFWFVPQKLKGEKEPQLWFKDWAFKEKCGNVFKFLSLLFDINYGKVYEMIDYDFALGFKQTTNVDYSKRLTNTEKIVQTIIPTKIEIVPKKFTSHGLKYWAKYGITEETLNKFNVRQIEGYYITSQNKPERTYVFTQFAFAYTFVDKYKIMRPMEDKKYKWLSNNNKYKYEGSLQLPMELVNGKWQLKKGRVLTITKAYKEVMFFKQFLDKPAIALVGESVIMPEKGFHTFLAAYEYIIVWLDNDIQGIASTKEYQETCRQLPVYYIQNDYYKNVTDAYEHKKDKDCVITEIEYVYNKIDKIHSKICKEAKQQAAKSKADNDFELLDYEYYFNSIYSHYSTQERTIKCLL